MTFDSAWELFFNGQKASQSRLAAQRKWDKHPPDAGFLEYIRALPEPRGSFDSRLISYRMDHQQAIKTVAKPPTAPSRPRQPVQAATALPTTQAPQAREAEEHATVLAQFERAIDRRSAAGFDLEDIKTEYLEAIAEDESNDEYEETPGRTAFYASMRAVLLKKCTPPIAKPPINPSKPRQPVQAPTALPTTPKPQASKAAPHVGAKSAPSTPADFDLAYAAYPDHRGKESKATHNRSVYLANISSTNRLAFQLAVEEYAASLDHNHDSKYTKGWERFVCGGWREIDITWALGRLLAQAVQGGGDVKKAVKVEPDQTASEALTVHIDGVRAGIERAQAAWDALPGDGTLKLTPDQYCKDYVPGLEPESWVRRPEDFSVTASSAREILATAQRLIVDRHYQTPQRIAQLQQVAEAAKQAQIAQHQRNYDRGLDRKREFLAAVEKEAASIATLEEWMLDDGTVRHRKHRAKVAQLVGEAAPCSVCGAELVDDCQWGSYDWGDREDLICKCQPDVVAIDMIDRTPLELPEI